MLERGIKEGIIPRFDFPPPSHDHDDRKHMCCGILCKRKKHHIEENYSKRYEHLKGKLNHIKHIQLAEKHVYRKGCEDEEDEDLSFFDRFIISTDTEKRSFIYDFWKLIVALISFCSSQTGLYIAAF